MSTSTFSSAKEFGPARGDVTISLRDELRQTQATPTLDAVIEAIRHLKETPQLCLSATARNGSELWREDFCEDTSRFLLTLALCQKIEEPNVGLLIRTRDAAWFSSLGLPVYTATPSGWGEYSHRIAPMKDAETARLMIIGLKAAPEEFPFVMKVGVTETFIQAPWDAEAASIFSLVRCLLGKNRTLDDELEPFFIKLKRYYNLRQDAKAKGARVFSR